MKEKQNNAESRNSTARTFTAKLALLSATSKQTCVHAHTNSLPSFTFGAIIFPFTCGLPGEIW